jgi:hypothetical protein
MLEKLENSTQYEDFIKSVLPGLFPSITQKNITGLNFGSKIDLDLDFNSILNGVPELKNDGTHFVHFTSIKNPFIYLK